MDNGAGGDDPVAAAEALARRAAEYRERLMNLTGPDDELWPVARSIANQVLALGGVSAEEIGEALRRAQSREGDAPADGAES